MLSWRCPIPELPEVETVVQFIRPLVWGCEIVEFVCASKGRTPNVDVEQLRGQTIHHVDRFGKYISFKLDDGYLISHLRMTGQWLFADKDQPVPDTHRHFRWGMAMLDLEGEFSGYLWFRDVRRFGTLDWVPSLVEYEPFSRLGVDGLNLNGAKEAFKVAVKASKTRRTIKSFLLDQSIIAGVGNIYSVEVLFEVGVDPRMRACDLSSSKIKEICLKLHEIFLRSISLGGTSISDYTGGRYHEILKVYDREGEPCVGCGTKIERMAQAGRSTFYCPRCQGVE